MIMAIRFTVKHKKRNVCGKNGMKSLTDMMKKEKLFRRRNFSFPTVFFKEEIDLAILQEICILQQLQFSTCFIVCCVTRLFSS